MVTYRKKNVDELAFVFPVGSLSRATKNWLVHKGLINLIILVLLTLPNKSKSKKFQRTTENIVRVLSHKHYLYLPVLI